MIKVIFICHGNICRSTMAEFVMKDLVKRNNLEESFYITSAATSTEAIGCDVHHGTQKKLREENIPFGHHTARQFRASEYSEFDYILGMDSLNIRNLMKIVSGKDPDGKILKLLSFAGEKREDIADPWYTGNFDITFEDIKKGCEAFLTKLREEGRI